MKGRSRIITGGTDFVLSFLVEGLQVVVRDGPVFERAPHRHAVGGAHLEVLGHKTPGLRSPTERSTAHAGGIVLVRSLAGYYGVSRTLRINPNPGIALVLRTKCAAQDGGALVAQVVLAAVVSGVPLAALQQNYAQSGGG